LLPAGNQTGVVGNPKDLQERVILATQCVSRYKFTIPMVIDGMDGKVNRDYDAAPVRVTVVDIDGKVAFYAGRGPADFRIPPVERTLKKLIAHQGHMPPAAAVEWGQPVNGLRCGLSFDPQKLALGEGILVTLRFQNVSDRPLALPYDSAKALKHIAIGNENGSTLRLELLNADLDPPRRGRGANFQGIRPGENFESEFEARVVAAADAAPSVARTFRAVYRLEISRETLAAVSAGPRVPLWTGTIVSGTCVLQISAPPPGGKD
jgi:hypothetical protein